VRGLTAVRRGADTTSDRGAIAVMSVLFAVVAIGLGALVIDIGAIAVERREAQKAADLAATAAAQDLYVAGADPTATALTYTTGNGWEGDPTVTVDGDRVTVLTSAAELPGLFFPGLQRLVGGSSSASVLVAADATAEVRSPRGGGLLPVAAPLSQPPTADLDGEWCLKDGAAGQTLQCVGPAVGNFKFADINRSTNPQQIVANFSLGAEFDATIATNQISGAECSESSVSSDSVTEETAPFDCLTTQTGDALAATAGLYNTQPNRCEGRLAVVVNGSCTVSPNRWVEYYTPPLRPGSEPGKIDSAIFADPRFGYVPRIGVEVFDLQGTKTWPIVGFYGAYITGLYQQGDVLCDEEGCQRQQPLTVVTAELFNLDSVTDRVIGSGSDVETVTYLGSGTRVIRLVE
jgi:hypothetical protein